MTESSNPITRASKFGSRFASPKNYSLKCPFLGLTFAGFNPCWDETLTFQIRVPELALVRFVVEDYDTTSSNDFVGQFTLPLPNLREGGFLFSKSGGGDLNSALFFWLS